MNIYPADGNPKIAAMIMAFALFGKTTGAMINKLSFSFSSQEKANDFIKSIPGIARCYINDLTVDVMPAYSGSQNAAKIMNTAMFHYGGYLTHVNKLSIDFLSEEDADEFFNSINKYINDYFGSEAFSLKES